MPPLVPAQSPEARAASGRRLAAGAAALAVNGALLAFLARAPAVDDREGAVLHVTLDAPRRLAERSPAGRHALRAEPSTGAQPRDAPQPSAGFGGPGRDPDPMTTAPGAGGGGASVQPGQVDVARVLRRSLAGCSNANLVGLSRTEVGDCNQRFAERTKEAPAIPAPIDPYVRRYYDQVVAAQDPNAPGHPPGIACILRIGMGAKQRERRGPPHSLKLGPLPCYLMPPRGPLTVEADIQNPDELLKAEK